jgi:hypothetical protein
MLRYVCADINNNNFEFGNNLVEQPIRERRRIFFGSIYYCGHWGYSVRSAKVEYDPGVRIFTMIDLLLTLGAILLLGVVANIAVSLQSAWENQTHKRDW